VKLRPSGLILGRRRTFTEKECAKALLARACFVSWLRESQPSVAIALVAAAFPCSFRYL
jgi:hypothetical protein